MKTGKHIIVYIVLIAGFKLNFIEWDGAVVPIKWKGHHKFKSSTNKFYIKEAVIHDPEKGFTKECAKIIVKILDSTYKKLYLGKVEANTTQINSE